MDYLLTTSPVVPLPKGILSFDQCLANLAIPDLAKGRDRVSLSPQTIYSVGRLMADLCIVWVLLDSHGLIHNNLLWGYCPRYSLRFLKSD